MDTRALWKSFRIGVGLLLLAGGGAGAQPQPGECASGFCGTPKNNGGGGCGCGGGSILVNNTDIGKTYSKTDDYDGDGIADDFDNCPFVANRDQADQDGDKIGDVCDNCAGAANPDQHDVNLNGLGDVCDPDIDGDKVPNAADNCPYVPNVNQKDTDKNGVGDVCDPDMDGDNVMNRVDNCPLVYNPDQSKSAPGRFGDACDDDTDKDAIEDTKDNCRAVYNPDQSDVDGDGSGDVCDQDADSDKVCNPGGSNVSKVCSRVDGHFDNCPLVANADQADADKDGVGDACQTHGFCFVAGKNDIAPCLDPKNVFQVTAGPAIPSRWQQALQATGTSIDLAIYSNRENTSIQYSWAITQQPDGASDAVRHPTGTVFQSEAHEYHYGNESTRPVFTPTHPGRYKITLAADLVKPDPQYPGVLHAESTMEVQVDGPVVAAGGCNVGRRGSGAGVLVAGMLLVAGGAFARGRRRRRA